jgi:hypothetical protein
MRNQEFLAAVFMNANHTMNKESLFIDPGKTISKHPVHAHGHCLSMKSRISCRKNPTRFPRA